MATYKHLRSSTANKRPTTSITDGQLAINTNTASPGLFFKDSAGTGIVKVGPVHVGTTAPNATPAAGGSSGNYLGEQWLDTSVSPAQMKVWNGSAWVGIVADELPVSKLQDGDARQLLQTDAAGTGVEWTSNVDVPGTLDVTGATTLDSTLTVPLGSAASPTLRFSGDANSGLYSPGADQIAVATNGAGRLFVDASGNVGIANTSPSSFNSDGRNLVVGSGSGGQGLTIFSGTSHYGTIYFADGTSGDALYRGALLYNHASDFMRFDTASAERMRITSAGLVGIGTSSPEADLHINDATGLARLRFTGGAVGADNFEIGQAIVGESNSGFSIYDVDEAETRFVIDSSGRVGIGIASPSDLLHVYQNAADNVIAKLENAQGTNGNLLQFVHGSGGANNAYIGHGGDATGNLLILNAADSATAFSTNNIERARIDSSGRLLVGTSSVRASFERPNINVEGLNNAGITICRNNADASAPALEFGKTRSASIGGVTAVSNGDGLGDIRFYGANGSTLDNEAARISAQVDGTVSGGGANDMPGRLVFSTTADGASSPTERMRITQAGHLYIANTTGDYNTVGITLFSNGQAQANANGVNPLNLNRKGSDGKIVDFYRDTNNPGSISVTTTATTYATSSDYRLKENVTPVTDGITRLQQLRPSRFNFIADPAKTVDGFIAHEAQAVVPECVTGTKDEVDADGNPIYQGIDQSKLVPLLTAALQEAVAKIETLEGMVAVNNITIDEQQHQLSTLAARLTALESA
jgi:hypothetical protein